MKENLRRLQLIFRFTRLKPEMFYNVSFDGHEISLQGEKSKLNSNRLISMGFKKHPTIENWYLRNNIRIVKA